MTVDPGHHESSKLSNSFVNCPSCGCPCKKTDINCSYCQVPLYAKPSVSIRIKKAVRTLQWRYKLKPGRSGGAAKGVAKKIAGKALTILLGVVLTVIGGWFFMTAVSTGAFAEFLIGALFMLYGIYSVIHVIRPGSNLTNTD